VHWILELRRVELVRPEGDGATRAGRGKLPKDSTSSDGGGRVSAEVKREGRVSEGEGRRRGQERSEGVEGGDCFGGESGARECGGARECVERCGNAAEIRDKLAVIVSEAEEGLYIGGGGRERPRGEGLALVRVGAETGVRDRIAEKGDSGLREQALAGFGKKLVPSQESENFGEIAGVIGMGARKDEDVVDVDHYTDAKERGEDGVHGVLENRRGIGQTERHHIILE